MFSEQKKHVSQFCEPLQDWKNKFPEISETIKDELYPVHFCTPKISHVAWGTGHFTTYWRAQNCADNDERNVHRTAKIEYG